jgi:hypothetical protein
MKYYFDACLSNLKFLPEINFCMTNLIDIDPLIELVSRCLTLLVLMEQKNKKTLAHE